MNQALAGMTEVMAGFGKAIGGMSKALQPLVEIFQKLPKALGEAMEEAFQPCVWDELLGTLPKSRYSWLTASYDLQDLADWHNGVERRMEEELFALARRVDDRNKEVREARLRGQDPRTVFRDLADPRLDHRTHCEVCCLPKAKHVDHKPPGPTPDFVRRGQPGHERFQRWSEARNRLYQSALEDLTDQELLDMPLPTSMWRLYWLKEAARARAEALWKERWEEERKWRNTKRTRYAILVDDAS